MGATAPDAFWNHMRDQTVLVVGLSERTGVPAAQLLGRHGVRYFISDNRRESDLVTTLATLDPPPARLFCGEQTPDQLDEVDIVLIAPGVPRSIPLLVEAKRRAIPVLMDMDFVYPLLAHARIVAITGTDGKTTTTTLTGLLLQSLGNVVVAGNIGTSVLSCLDEIRDADWLVLEMSSFMLEETTAFRAHFSAILNLGEDHIDRYADADAYAAAKMAIVQHAESGDVLVVNADDARLEAFGRSMSDSRQLDVREVRRAALRDGHFEVGDTRVPASACGLNGDQNVTNILTAMTLAKAAGVSDTAICETLETFEGLPHRMENVGTFDGVTAYNDSKASNVHAVEAALRNFGPDGDGRRVVLILGGRDKGLDFSILKPHASTLRCLVCYGEDGQKLRDALAIKPSLYTYRFDDAVALAAAQCHSGDALVMSPGCTSWDQFGWYGERGDTFRALVPKLLSKRRQMLREAMGGQVTSEAQA